MTKTLSAALGASLLLLAVLLAPDAAAGQAALSAQSQTSAESSVSAVTVEGRRRQANDEHFVPGRFVNVGKLPPCAAMDVRDSCDRMEDLADILRSAYALYDAGDYKGALKEFNNVSRNWGEYAISTSKGIEGGSGTLTEFLQDPQGLKQLHFASAAHALTQEAALMDAELYLNSSDEVLDTERGVGWLQRVARAGKVVRRPTFDVANPYRFRSMPQVASVWLASLYRRGDKVERDPVQSRQWYEQAAKFGYVPAYKALGDIYAAGAGTPRDARRAAAYYQKAADYGFTPAQTSLAALYEAGGPGLAADSGKAVALYQRAAGGEDADALYSLALAYEAGDGVAADPQRAVELYRTAAEKGDRRAQAAYGLHLYEGSVVPKDLVQARRWLERAAAAGEPEAIYNLAVMMARGEGGERDVSKAWVLFTFSRIGGQTQASTALASLERRMTPAERASAAALLPPGVASAPQG